MSDSADDQGLAKLTFSITTGGHRYDMKIGDFSAMDEMAYSQVTGGKTLMQAFSTGEVDSVMVAGLVWLFRRKYEKKLSFQSVAEQFKWADMDTIEIERDGNRPDAERPTFGVEVGADPEA